MIAIPTQRPRQWASIAAFSLLINLLYLTGPIFMLQVYDRVLTSANLATLAGLFAIVILLFVFFGILDFIRMQVLTAQGEAAAAVLADKAYTLSIANACGRLAPGPHQTATDDVAALRQFMISPTRAALHDLPWTPLFLLFVFSLHPSLGVVALIAAILLCALAVINERTSHASLAKASELSIQARNTAAIATRNADLLVGNGMVHDIQALWRREEREARSNSASAAVVTSGFTTTTKALRLAIQSLILAVGAYYVIAGELTAGGMIAGSIVFSRAISPLEQLLGNYALFARARTARRNIETWETLALDDGDRVSLPAPTQSLSVDGLTVHAPGTDTPILDQVSFEVQAGDVLGVIGASGSGKSTLVQAIVGARPAAAGTVRFDGAERDQWAQRDIGHHIGYLPQSIDLVPGTVAENIARHRPDADFDAVLRASHMADIHGMVLRLPDGYNTVIGPAGMALSAGQRQRIALARALYNDPFLIVMDEPNSNLDVAGDAALNAALTRLRDTGKITIVVAHRPNVLASLTQMLVLADGRVRLFGPASKVLATLRSGSVTPIREVAR